MISLVDIQLLVKKILVGVLVFLVPAIIIAGGLLLTQQILSINSNTLQTQSSTLEE